MANVDLKLAVIVLLVLLGLILVVAAPVPVQQLNVDASVPPLVSAAAPAKAPDSAATASLATNPVTDILGNSGKPTALAADAIIEDVRAGPAPMVIEAGQSVAYYLKVLNKSVVS